MSAVLAAAPAAPLVRRLRAAWRLARALLHALHGLLTVRVAFAWLTRPARERCIGRWSRRMFEALGVRVEQRGALHESAPLIVANHVSWLDVMALHAACPQARFVAMAELRQWGSVARLADGARTIYLQRRRLRDLHRVVREAAAALRAGDRVAVFPEGVVSEGHGLLPFHGNLLQSAIDAGVAVQAVALRYSDAAHAVSDAVDFTGGITLAQSLWRIACAEGLVLQVRVLPPRATAGERRRELAARLRADIAAALALPPRG
ncbi:MAG: 1-acyl-sn-glycerol-3-phosphate acyltransferase [Burkholderiales bacterium]|nr:1-acyl-sn-glycerol-3-phosphate acyltransferase [Burkholderiales bacterium]